ncbi:hypothetical protein DSM106972_047570 [Dulcicalothrix desertica PCC 7102]|uniref:Uncharacterized protein n=1 Tax=Dulcicalothrix desertica PCC 7102 TaxID=232991 RepID=A0A433VCP1_9CYAN|nr:hypothetical protein [Dulcicalothrix desertica]RUT03843.1 hypothetical protein DSM106972_047570 [Dulcicalothrix desertica PCC 7102]
MAIVLSQPQFQVLTHLHTGVISGRIYFPALFLAEFYSYVIQWLQRQEISFDEKDLKSYSDGSFRVYFKAQQSPETEFLALIAMIEESISA